MKINKLLLLCLLFALTQGCTNNPKHVLDNKILVNYFETDEVQITPNGNTIEILVNDSKRIQRENKREGYKWITAEPFGSFSALIFLNQLEKKSIKADSIIVKINNQNREERYAYKISDLQNVKKYADTCTVFSKLIGQSQYSMAKEFLNADLLKIQDSVRLNNHLKMLSLPGAVSKSELIAFAISEKMVGLYMNVYYKNAEAKTYIFTFYMGGDGKIAGISTPDVS